MSKVSCPICDSANVRTEEFCRRMVHRGKQFEVTGLVATRCSNCGSSFFAHGQSEHNQKRVQQAKSEQVLGVTPEWICSLRTRLKITQGEAGKLFGGGKIAFCRYESGTVAPSQSLVRLLLLADRLPGAFEELRKIAFDESAVMPLMGAESLLASWSEQLADSQEFERVKAMWSANQSDFDGADLGNAA